MLLESMSCGGSNKLHSGNNQLFQGSLGSHWSDQGLFRVNGSSKWHERGFWLGPEADNASSKSQA
jgi:hypothetical protein